MSFLTSWLIARFVRWIRARKGGATSAPEAVLCSSVPAYELPEWPRGASLGAEMHDYRGFSPDSDMQPEMLSITLRRDEATGRIYDCKGRELISVEIRGKGRRDFRSDSAGILRALSSEVLAGQMITLLLVDNAAFAESANSCRMGLHFIDATCVWAQSMEGFGEAPLDAELAVV